VDSVEGREDSSVVIAETPDADDADSG